MSDDGEHAVVVIALLGNPFSPGYARARRRDPASDALAFSSMNVAIYSRRSSRWSLVEQCVRERQRTANSVEIGSSTMGWKGDHLEITIATRSTPLGLPLRGRLTLHPEVRTERRVALDDAGDHDWWPVAPLSRLEVDFSLPSVRFSGHGYHDANAGAVPLDSTFESWSWGRARTDDGAILTYDVRPVSSADRSHGFRISPAGKVDELQASRKVPLPRTIWGIDRQARIDAGYRPVVVRTLEDGPFYARALVETHLEGRAALMMHETLAAHRLRKRWVRLLTRCRM